MVFATVAKSTSTSSPAAFLVMPWPCAATVSIRSAFVIVLCPLSRRTAPGLVRSVRNAWKALPEQIRRVNNDLPSMGCMLVDDPVNCGSDAAHCLQGGRGHTYVGDAPGPRRQPRLCTVRRL